MTLLGAVLTGGASRRMGRTKAMVDVDGVPMGRRVAEALRQVGCADVVAVGGDADELAALDLAVLADDYPGEGPVGGVLTALRHARNSGADTALIVACDLPALDVASLDALVRAVAERPDVDVVLAHGDKAEPLCALWRIEAAATVQEYFDAGLRSMYRVLERLEVVEIAVAPEALQNVNTPEDLAGAE